jgi:hypothetical protein
LSPPNLAGPGEASQVAVYERTIELQRRYAAARAYRAAARADWR